MLITLAKYPVKPHWIECEDCEGWFDPNENPPITGAVGYTEYTVCKNCADERGWYACEDCGTTEDTVDCEGTHYCMDCVHEAGWESCEHCGDWVSNDDIRQCDNSFFCADCAERQGWLHCAGCNEWIGPNSQVGGLCGDSFCQDCFFEVYTICDSCGEVVSQEECNYNDNGTFCNDCNSGGEDFEPNGFRRRTGCTTKTGSERCYGLELETNECDGYDDLYDSGAWGAKDDCSVSAKEFYSAILDGDDGLDAVAEIAALAERNGWEVGYSCGYHLHLDMRNESDDSLYAAAYAYLATYDVWTSFVPSARRRNSYCARSRITCADLEARADREGHSGTFQSFVNACCRDWVNFTAYNKFSTFEVRLHPGTLDEDTICNWIKAHTRFVDWACSLGLQGVEDKLDGLSNVDKFELIAREAWNDSKLHAFYAEKGGFPGRAGSQVQAERQAQWG